MDINRKIAYDILLKIEKENQYSNIAINNYTKNKKNIRENFIRELVYGCIENKKYLEFIISSLTNKRIKDIFRANRILLMIGLYQLEFMNSIREYTAVDETVKLSKKIDYKRAGFINGVLRNYHKNKDSIFKKLENIKKEDFAKYLSIYYSYNVEIINLLIRDYGIDRIEELLKAFNKRPSIYIRTNLSKIERKDLLEKLEYEGFDVKPGQLSHTSIKISGRKIIENSLYQSGYFSIQDEASQLLIETLSINKNDRILDVCAAPGGKSFASAERLKGSGQVVARDIFDHKIENMEIEKKRLSLDNIKIEKKDALVFDKKIVEVFDKVICDVPCSALGVMAKKPEIKYKKLDDDFYNLPKIQMEILRNTSKYVKKGGTIIYSTCTVNKDENEKVVENFLNDNSKFKLDKQILLMPDKNQTDGFFIAKILREE